jgi:FkbH-like protein
MHPLLKIRALILDLDNTLYQGVFGEDSAEDLHSDNFHTLLQKELRILKESGVILCIASKNNLSDIDAILESNLLSELRKEDFAIIEGGWESKSESISRIISELNFGENFVAFIDDNKRELFEVGSKFPNLICIDGSDPKEVISALQTSLSFDTSSSKEIIRSRFQDIQNSTSRKQELNGSIDKDSILVEIGTKVRAQQADTSEELLRANELFRKTNQFNLTLARTDLDVSHIFAGSGGIVLSSISDRFSDSGIISAIYYLMFGDTVEIVEFVISCRALGRDAEKYIFRSMLEKISDNYRDLTIKAAFREGPKNRPAFDFIHRYFIEESEKFILDSNKLFSDTSKWYDLICEK